MFIGNGDDSDSLRLLPHYQDYLLELKLCTRPAESGRRDREVSINKIVQNFLGTHRPRRFSYQAGPRSSEVKRPKTKLVVGVKCQFSKKRDFEHRTCIPVEKKLAESTRQRVIKVIANASKQTTNQAMQLVPEARQQPLKRRAVTANQQLKSRRTAREGEELGKRQRKFMQFIQLISLTNYVRITSKTSQFRAFIQRGNNGALVGHLLRKRPWWSIVEEPTRANLVLTEWVKHDVVSDIADAQSTQRLSINCSEQRSKSVLKEPKFGLLQKQQEVVFYKRKSLVQKLVYFGEFPGLLGCISQQPNSPFLFKEEDIAERSLDLNWQVTADSLSHNHLENGQRLHCKRLMYQSLLRHMGQQGQSVESVVPQTIVVGQGQAKLEQFVEQYRRVAKTEQPNIWIVKPGQNSNRGTGIRVSAALSEILKLAKERRSGTTIIQRYLTRCQLFDRRKFDIRCFMLVTQVQGRVQGYFYKEGYLRTSSKEFTLGNLKSRLVHLTNDAVQKDSQDYGRFEGCNKISFMQYQRYLEEQGISHMRFREAVKGMKDIAGLLLRAVKEDIGGRPKALSFQLFGLDFMLNQQFSPVLIECNSNPCLECSGNLLSRLIPQMLENVMRIAVDPVFPPNKAGLRRGSCLWTDGLQKNNFQVL